MLRCTLALLLWLAIATLAEAGPLDDLVQRWVSGRVGEARGISRNAFNRARDVTNGTDPIMSDNDWVNQVRAEARRMNRELSAASHRSAQDWIGWSGTNVLSVPATLSALQKLRNAKEEATQLAGVCDALRAALAAVRVWDRADPKKLGHFMTSMHLADTEARAEAVEAVKRLNDKACAMREALGTAVNAVSDSLDTMVKVREQYRHAPPIPRPRQSPTSYTTPDARSAQTLAAWQSVPAARDKGQLSRPTNLLAAQTEYQPTGAGGFGGGGVVRLPGSVGPFGSGGGSVFNLPPAIPTPSGLGYTTRVGSGGGWDNLPIRRAVTPPPRPTPPPPAGRTIPSFPSTPLP